MRFDLKKKCADSIYFDSALHEGACFSFFAEAPSYGGPTNLSDHNFGKVLSTSENVSILVVDDLEINLTIVRELLLEYGVCVDAASSGQEAVTKFLSSDPAHYQLIFMDIQMPDMDGFETTERIRGTGYGNAETIPIYALSANPASESLLHAQICGMNGYLMKPVSAAQLMRVIGMLI